MSACELTGSLLSEGVSSSTTLFNFLLFLRGNFLLSLSSHGRLLKYLSTETCLWVLSRGCDVEADIFCEWGILLLGYCVTYIKDVAAILRC